jgi:branched-chain amino acid transport system permease protein
VPLLVRQPYLLHVLILCNLFATFAIGWNFVTGFAGLKTFGHHALFALAAYASALLSKQLAISPWLTIWLGSLLAMGVGLIAAVPALRISSIPHIAIVTLAFAEIVRIAIANLKDITRGEMGLVGIPAFDPIQTGLFGTLNFAGSMKIPFFYLSSVFMIICWLAVYVLMRSRFGLAFVAIRNSQDAAESLGINLARYKFVAFGVSAFIVGLSGALYAHYIRVLTPHSVAGLDVMIFVIAMVLVGGIGTHSGPVVGALLLVAGTESLRIIGEYRLLIYGLLTVMTILFFPQGLVSIVEAFRSVWRGRRTSTSSLAYEK